MSDLNHVSLIGRLARDCELKYTNTGTAVLNFSVAVGKSIPPKDGGSGKWETKTSFLDCVFFGQSAERKAKMMTKGRQVGIDGELQQDKWEKDGQMHYRVKIMAQSVQILALPKGQAEKGEEAVAAAPGAAPAAGPEDFKDSIPF